MKVKELIEILQKYKPDSEVKIACEAQINSIASIYNYGPDDDIMLDVDNWEGLLDLDTIGIKFAFRQKVD